MSQRPQPIDEFFKNKLEDISYDAPMHVWEAIDKKRNRKYKFLLALRKRWPGIAVLLMIVLVVAQIYLANRERATWQIESLPIPQVPINKDTKTVEDHSIQAPEPTSPIAQHDELNRQVTQGKNSNSIFSAQPMNPGSKEVMSPGRQSTEDPFGNRISVFPKIDDRRTDGLYPLSNNLPDLKHLRGEQSPSIIATKQLFLYRSPIAEEMRPLPSREKGKATVSLEVVAGLSRPFRTLLPLSEEAQDYLVERENTEKVIGGINGGIRLNLVTKRGLSFRTGLFYTQINERFSYFVPEADRNSAGTISPNPRADSSALEEDYYLRSSNGLKFVDIPVLIGYEKSFGRLGLGINGGTHINVSFAQKGKLLDATTLKPTSISSSDDDAYNIYKKRLGLSYYGSFNFSYQISSSVRLLFEPYIHYQPVSLTLDEFGIRQKYMNAGLLLGLKKQIR